MPSRRPDPTDSMVAVERQGERIAKLLARAGVASRREIERMIAEGRIARDGVAIDTPATVLRSLHGVTVDGNPVAAAAPARLFAFHKPAGLLVTERDPRGRPTIYDRLPAALPRVVPVGRLDLATEGLLLLTTDGGLKRQLELPATGVERTYRARAYGAVSQAQLEELIDGIEIDGVRYGSIDANLERRTGANTWIELTLTEGKNREVRRVLEHLGLEVSRLIRTRYGPFVLGDMPAGAVGEVRQHDLVAFRQSLKGGKGGDKDMRVMALPLPEAAAQPGEAAPASPGAGRRPPRPQTDRDAASARRESGEAEPSDRGARRPVSRQARPATEPKARSIDNRSAGRGAGKPVARPSKAAPERTQGGQAVASKRVGNAPPNGGQQRPATRETTTPDQPPRPPRPQRKPGWARAKPRPGPRGKR